MKNLIVFLAVLVLAANGAIELNLKSDGSINTNGKPIEVEDIMAVDGIEEVILNVDPDVPYNRVLELMKDLKEIGISKVGLKTSKND